MDEMIEALGIGDAMVDLTTLAPTLPPRGGNVWGTAPSMSPGGTTANVAANLARLGVRSGFAGGIGTDPYGQYTLDEFRQVGVDTRDTVLLPDSYTGVVLAIIDPTGERTFVACGRGGAHTRLTPEMVEHIQMQRAQIIHTSGVCMVEEPSRWAILRALEKAHDMGIPTYFDPNIRLDGDVFPEPLFQAMWKVLEYSTVVLLSEEELRLLTRVEDLEHGARLIAARGPETVVVKRGERGVFCLGSQGVVEVPAFRVGATNTTGAGDAYNAGFITAHLRGMDARQALVFACAVAGIKVTRPGARSVPTHEEVLAFLAERS